MRYNVGVFHGTVKSARENFGADSGCYLQESGQ
jgi:hypothetical protein